VALAPLTFLRLIAGARNTGEVQHREFYFYFLPSIHGRFSCYYFLIGQNFPPFVYMKTSRICLVG
jgi:hypothetical protein